MCMRDWSGECRLRLRRQPLLAATQGFESFCYWALRDLMQVGGYRPQFRPHRGVIWPERYLLASSVPFSGALTCGLSDHTPMRPGAGEYQGLGQLTTGCRDAGCYCKTVKFGYVFDIVEVHAICRHVVIADQAEAFNASILQEQALMTAEMLSFPAIQISKAFFVMQPVVVALLFVKGHIQFFPLFFQCPPLWMGISEKVRSEYSRRDNDWLLVDDRD